MWAHREFTQQYHCICNHFFQQYLKNSGLNEIGVKITQNKCTWVIFLVVEGRVNLWRMVGWEVWYCNVSSGLGITRGAFTARFSKLFLCCSSLPWFTKQWQWSPARWRDEPFAKSKEEEMTSGKIIQWHKCLMSLFFTLL